ncbi:MAG TPA: archaellin/type IV pilin N-terminal domain-containing protein [Candidatus Nanoarchaeia archaeon]|nr:archaellin/type IV pilin N-terminal domain-containing protein [Candidatus Nanoarchaeia archaeon]
MRCISDSKKGVSPLIATVLLIAFAVALGSVVINWGLSIDLGGNDKCRNVEISARVSDYGEACYGGQGKDGYVRFSIDNRGTEDITGIALWMMGSKQTKLFDINDVLIKRASIFEKTGNDISYDFTYYGDLKELQLIPKIGGEVCTKNAIKAQKIGVCKNN